MLQRFLNLFSGQRTSLVAGTPAPSSSFRFRPLVEGLEERTVPSAASSAASIAVVQQAEITTPVTINLNATVTDIQAVGDQLIATLNIAGQTVEVPFDVTLTPEADGDCQILDLRLENGLHLNLLGLQIDTSPICLEITADPDGGILGGLLSGLLCQPGLDLDGLLSAINTDALLNNELLTVLNEAFDALLPDQLNLTGHAENGNNDEGPGRGRGQAHAPGLQNHPHGQPPGQAKKGGQAPGQGPGRGGSCDILNLEVGPLDLTLLGLNVYLHDCDDGPVTVDITAQRGQLLGDVLCGVVHLLDTPANLSAINAKLNQLIDALGSDIVG